MKYTATLTLEERNELLEITKKGKRSAQIIRNALILLNCDQGEYGDKKKNADIASVLKIGERTIDGFKFAIYTTSNLHQFSNG